MTISEIHKKCDHHRVQHKGKKKTKPKVATNCFYTFHVCRAKKLSECFNVKSREFPMGERQVNLKLLMWFWSAFSVWCLASWIDILKFCSKFSRKFPGESCKIFGPNHLIITFVLLSIRITLLTLRNYQTIGNLTLPPLRQTWCTKENTDTSRPWWWNTTPSTWYRSTIKSST